MATANIKFKKKLEEKMIKFNFFIIFIVMLSFFSCTSDAGIGKEVLPLAFQEVPTLKYPFGLPLNSDIKNYRWGDLKGEERQKAMHENMMRMEKAASIAAPVFNMLTNNESLDIPSFIKKAESVFEQNSENEALFLAEQMVAFEIQKKLFPRLNDNIPIFEIEIPELDRDELKLLKYATELNIKNGNPNADLLGFNLQMLKQKTTIDKTLLKEWASQSIKNAVVWYGDERLCTNCNNKSSSLHQNLKIRTVQKGIQHLKKFSESN